MTRVTLEPYYTSGFKCSTDVNLLRNQTALGGEHLLQVGNSGTGKLSHLSKVTQLLVALGFEPRSSAPRERTVNSAVLCASGPVLPIYQCLWTQMRLLLTPCTLNRVF